MSEWSSDVCSSDLFGHLLVNLFLGDGVKAIDFAFVAGKLADPFWIVYDMLLLWLALIHGANGMRTIINDYAHGRLRVVFLVLLAGATIALLVLGSLVLTTFDPCPAGSPPELLPPFCSDRTSTRLNSSHSCASRMPSSA